MTAAALRDYLGERLAGFKVPRHIEFVEELPRNPSGKVVKRLLRDKAWEGRDRRIG
jgi:acyl-coenzyme A synthetase/AMP-(fatty) acid ligase